MAFSHGQTDQHLGSFSVLNGVMVKISDKFKPPEKVTLPHGWIQSDASELLSFQYDFRKEQQAIQLAEEERLIIQKQEAEVYSEGEEDYVNEDIIEENVHGTCDASGTPEVHNNHKIKEAEILTPLVIENNKSGNEKKENKLNINFEEFENNNQNPFELVELQTLNELDELRSVLEPNTVNTKKIKSSITSNDLDDNIDLSIFSPMEPLYSVADNSTVDNLIDTSAQHHVSEVYNSNNKNGTLNWTRFDVEATPSKLGPVYRSSNPFQPDSQIQVGAHQYTPRPPRSIPFDTGNQVVGIEPSNYNEGLPRTKSLPNLQDQSDYENVEPLTRARTASKSELSASFNKSTEQLQFYDNTIPTNRIENIMKQYNFKRMNDAAGNPPPYSSDNTGDNRQHNPVATSSMQFSMQQPMNSQPQFTQGIPSNTQQFMSHPHVNTSQFAPPALSTEQSNQSATTYPMSSMSFSNSSNHNNIGSYIPPYMNSFSNISTSMQTPIVQSVPSNITSTFQNAHDSLRSGPMMIQSRLPAHNLNISPVNQVIQLQPPFLQQQPSSFYGGLPPVPHERVQPISSFGSTVNGTLPLSQNFDQPNNPTYIPSGALETGYRSDTVPSKFRSAPTNNDVIHITSWLVDPTHSLSTSEKNFMYQLNAMGFPQPCVSRTIKRLGLDDKEVLDFLCLVHELREKGYDGDDVEMALLNNEDKQKVTSYLDMVSTFKELGFQPKNIHEALKSTSCDQNKALDYLTR